MDIWYIFPRFGILCQEKSGNPAQDGQVKSPSLPPSQKNDFALITFLAEVDPFKVYVQSQNDTGHRFMALAPALKSWKKS
jgi:hypothetical protein